VSELNIVLSDLHIVSSELHVVCSELHIVCSELHHSGLFASLLKPTLSIYIVYSEFHIPNILGH
jgi:hypothetical protein